MDRLIELGQLFDFYGALLTERQRMLVRQYAYENLSLAEIAEREGISRQGVRDGIVRAEQQLRELEHALHLLERAKLTRNAVEILRQIVEETPISGEAAARMEEQLDRLSDLWEDEDGI